MRHPILITAATLSFALLIAAEGAALQRGGEGTRADSAELIKALDGRTAGEATSCVNLKQMRNTQIVDGAVIYEESARRWWVNRPQNGDCPDLKRDRSIATRTPSDRLCNGDLVRIFDPTTPVQYGSCSLGSFTPYTK